MTPTERNAKLEEVREAIRSLSLALNGEPWPWRGDTTIQNDEYLTTDWFVVHQAPGDEADRVWVEHSIEIEIIEQAPAWLSFLLGEVERLEKELRKQ